VKVNALIIFFITNEIYLALYQGVSETEESKNIYKQFSRGFFDLIIVDKLMKLCDELETKLTQTQTEREKIINAAVKQLLTV
jgi:hypothetical protein